MESPGRGSPMNWRLGLSILALVAGCGKNGGDEAEPAPRVPVGIGAVVRDTISQVIALPGRLMPLPGGSALLRPRRTHWCVPSPCRSANGYVRAISSWTSRPRNSPPMPVARRHSRDG
jgi:hypothetical protein